MRERGVAPIAECKKPANAGFFLKLGVTDGIRTHDNQNHNLGLYQLSYSHRCCLTGVSPFKETAIIQTFFRLA